MLRVNLIGCGAIGTAVLELLGRDADVVFERVVTGPTSRERAKAAVARHAPGALVADALDLDGAKPDLVVECAGHGAIKAHVLAALTRGVPCVVSSVGALAEPGLVEQLEKAARQGSTQLQLLSGAIGGIDALAAARLGGLSTVVYTGRKPPLAWAGTPAEKLCDLGTLAEPFVIFEGTAREAARTYPKNANVAATVSLAGVGLDSTRVKLLADPGVQENVHHVQASGAFGSFELTMRGNPLASNPKTSALTVYSVARAIINRARPMSI